MRHRKYALIALGLSVSMVASMVAPVRAENSQTIPAYMSQSSIAAERKVDETQLSPWLVTEVVTDSISGERYTYLEIFNNSDQELDFADYTLLYDYPSGGGYVFSKNAKATYKRGKNYTKSAYLSATGNTELTSIKVGAGETLILWYNNNLTTTSLQEFSNYYNLSADANVVRLNHGGIHSSQKRGYRIGKDTDTIITEAYSDEYGNKIANGTNKDAYQFVYPEEGIKCNQMSIATATPGTVITGQVPETRVSIRETPVSIEEVTAVSNGSLEVTARIPYEGTAGAMSVLLTYNQTAGAEGETITSENMTAIMIPKGDGETFSTVIPAETLFGTSADIYVSASYGGENKAVSETKTVQLNRQEVPAEKAAPLIITETAPTSTEDGAERYDFFELYNQSNETINLGYWTFFYYYNYPEQTASEYGKVWSLGDFTQTIAPGETKVVWLNAKGLLVDDFNNFYGTDLVAGKDIVEVNYSGLHATDPRWFRIGTSESNAFTLAAFNEETWQMTTSGKSLHYAAPNDSTGVNKSIPVIMENATPGKVAKWQISDVVAPFNGYPDYPKNDGKKPTLKVCNESEYPIPEVVNEGEEIQVMYDVDLLSGAVGSGRLNAFKDYIDENNPTNHPGGSESLKKRPYLIGTEIYYKLDDNAEWTVVQEKKQWRLGHYFMKIPSDVLFGHDSITYKVRAYTLYGYNETSEVTVKINRLNDTKGKVRLNVQDGSVISGKTTITANDGANNENTEILVNGEKQNQSKMFEDGAYFAVKTDGVDSYFKDGITAPYGDNDRELITILYNWCEESPTKVIKVDNKYFKYNEETNSYDVTLTIWAGSSGTPFEEIYECVFGTNHEDFKVSGLQMRLTNGKSYLPIKIAPDNEKTNTSTDLSAWHTIGDSAGMVTHLDATFSIPAVDAEAVGITLDTTAMKDGEHIVEGVSGDKVTSAKVIVDNTAPTIKTEIEEEAILDDTILLEEGSIAEDANGIKEVVVSLDDELLELPTAIIPNGLKEGNHTMKVVATDVAGNAVTKEIHFKTQNTNPTVSGVENKSEEDKSAKLTVNVGKEKADVHFYEGKNLTEANGGIIKGEYGASKNGSVPYQLFAINAGDVEDTDEISVKWDGTSGNVNKSHPLTMFVRNVKNDRWETIASTDKNEKLEAVFKAENHVKDGKATILVQTLAEGDKPMVKANNKTAKEAADIENAQSGWDGSSRPETYDFAMAWQTDTQYYTESFPYHYDNMNQWIADNAEDWKIKYVMHTGDIVDDCDMTGEWINADRSMKILDDAGIPYGVLGGNHDVFAGAENYGNYWKYFGADRFEGKSFYGGSYKNNLGHYDLISEGGQDFIIIYMSWDIYTNELNWMNEVLEKYSDRKAILAFHRYIGVGAGDQKLDYTGLLIQDQVVAKNKNVIAVVNGHYHGSSLQTDAFDDDGDGIKERTVYQVCTDYQSDAEGGSEYLKFLYFDFANNKIYVNSYSPYRDDYNYYDTKKLASYAEGTRAINQDIAEFDVAFDTTEKQLTTKVMTADVRTKTKIGTVKEATGTVEYQWNGLKADTEYSWYAKVTNDKKGITYTDVKTFKTEKTSTNQGNDSDETPNQGDEEGSIPKVGTVYPQKGIYYKVLTASAQGGTVATVGVANKTLTTVKVPSTVQINGLSYKVTQISNQAFAGNKNIKKVIISSKYLTKIGKQAFKKCVKLQTVKIYSKKLRTIGSSAFEGDKKLSQIVLKTLRLKKAGVGKKAFRGIKKTCRIKTPASKVKTYKVIIRKRGAGKKVKVVK